MCDVCATMRGFFSDSLTSWGVVTSRVQRGWLWERMCLHAEPQSAPLSFQSTAVLAVVQLQLPRYSCGRPDVMQTCVHLGHLCLTEASGKTVGLQRTLIMNTLPSPVLSQHSRQIHPNTSTRVLPPSAHQQSAPNVPELAAAALRNNAHSGPAMQAENQPAASTK